MTVAFAKGINFNAVTAKMFPPNPNIPLSIKGNLASLGTLTISFLGFFF